MNRWKAILAAALIFVTGAGTGALIQRTASRAAAPAPRDPRTPPSWMEGRPDFMGRLKRDLELSEDQARRIEVILQDGRKKNRQIWETVQPQLREEMKKARERIHAELNPDQRTRYDDIMKRSRERRGPRPEGSQGPGSDGGWRRGGGRPPQGSGTNPPPAASSSIPAGTEASPPASIPKPSPTAAPASP